VRRVLSFPFVLSVLFCASLAVCLSASLRGRRVGWMGEGERKGGHGMKEGSEGTWSSKVLIEIVLPLSD